MEYEERTIEAIRKKGDDIAGYHNFERIDFVVDEDIIGFDANVLVDMVDDKNFRKEVKDEVTFNVLRIITTNVALGEAKHVLIKKRKYKEDIAIKGLKKLLNEFSIEKIQHDNKSNLFGEKWVKIVKQKMYIKKISTFPNDCKILANLFFQKKINTYYTEDKDIKKAVKILKLPIRVRIMPAADNLNNFKIKRYFNQKRKDLRK